MDNKKSEIFEKTYRIYKQEISGLNILSRAEYLGARKNGTSLAIPFYNKMYRLSPEGVFDSDGNKADFTISIVLFKYVLLSFESHEESPEGWSTFREFRDSGPLTVYFANNTNKIIETTFAGKIEELRSACNNLKGKPHESLGNYDLSYVFNVLPKVPMVLNFNDRDDEFPANASVIYKKSAENYLDMESLAITATWFAGKLISGNRAF